jgi:KTSC domain
MKRVRLGSSAIASVSYDEKNKTLSVEFRDGDTYRYAHVPEFVYRELLKAESAGTFWNQLKDNYEFTRVDDTN